MAKVLKFPKRGTQDFQNKLENNKHILELTEQRRKLYYLRRQLEKIKKEIERLLDNGPDRPKGA